METKNLESWEQLEQAIADIEADLARSKPKDSPSEASKPLFRGHGSSSWSLQTTLERSSSREISMLEYFHFARMAKPRVETFTGQTWEMPSESECKEWQDRVVNENMGTIYKLPGFNYLTYLRHHGFPSPLLDWTASPYVAAFFAFRQPPGEADHVSIYAYVESTGDVKWTAGSSPEIIEFGQYIKSTRRHFLQQSRYTICTVNRDNQLYYQPHESVAGRTQGQDLLWKMNVPADERKKALIRLSRMNVNAYSLFNSEDSLLEAIAVEDLFLKDHL